MLLEQAKADVAALKTELITAQEKRDAAWAAWRQAMVQQLLGQQTTATDERDADAVEQKGPDGLTPEQRAVLDSIGKPSPLDNLLKPLPDWMTPAPNPMQLLFEHEEKQQEIARSLAALPSLIEQDRLNRVRQEERARLEARAEWEAEQRVTDQVVQLASETVGTAIPTPTPEPVQEAAVKSDEATRKKETLEDFLMPYLVKFFREGTYGSGKELQRDLANKAGTPGSPFKAGTGRNDPLYVTERGQTLADTTLNKWISRIRREAAG